jgi:hypothetical protein
MSCPQRQKSRPPAQEPRHRSTAPRKRDGIGSLHDGNRLAREGPVARSIADRARSAEWRRRGRGHPVQVSRHHAGRRERGSVTTPANHPDSAPSGRPTRPGPPDPVALLRSRSYLMLLVSRRSWVCRSPHPPIFPALPRHHPQPGEAEGEPKRCRAGLASAGDPPLVQTVVGADWSHGRPCCTEREILVMRVLRVGSRNWV